MARARGGRDYEVGGKVSLEDSFSAVAQRVSSAYGRLYGLFRGGSAGIARGLGAIGGAGRMLGAMLLGPEGIVAGLFALVRASLSASATTENLELAFTTLAHGNAQAALTHIAALREFAIGKPFEFTQLAESSRMLQTFGFQMGEVTGLLQDFGDAAFTANTGYLGVQRMTLVFGQMHATGKTTFGQLGMLVRSGIPAFDILREELHLSDQQLRNIARSSIKADDVIAALRRGMQKRFAGGMERASHTITARLSDLQDVATKFLSLVGGQMRPVFASFLDEFASGLRALDIPTAARNVGTLLTVVLRFLRVAVEPLAGAMKHVRDRWNSDTNGAFGHFRRFLSNVTDVVEGVVTLLAGDQGSGLAQIPKAMRDRLVRDGLWMTTIHFMKWIARTKALITGFIDGLVEEFEKFRTQATSLARALGIDQLPLNRTNDDARSLGASLAHAAGNAVRLRIALLALQGALAVSSGVGSAVGWARGLDGALRFSITALRGSYVRLGAAVRSASTALLDSPIMAAPRAVGGAMWRYVVFGLTQAFNGLKTAALSSARALLMNPITWVIGALVVSALAARYMMVHWDELSAHMKRSPIFAGLAAGVSILLGPISGFVFAFLRARDAVRQLSSESAVFRGIVNFVKTYFAMTATFIYVVFAWWIAALVGIGSYIGKFFGWVGGQVMRFFRWIGSGASDTFGSARSKIGKFFGWLGGQAARAGRWIMNTLFPPWLRDYLTGAWNDAKWLIGSAVEIGRAHV